MKTLIYIIAVIVLSTSLVEAGTRRYRLTHRDNPSTTASIIWEQYSGSNPVLYYGTTDEGTNFGAYPSSTGPTLTNVSSAMNNNIVRLTGLTANTVYYFVINDNEGTSARMSFRTASDNPADDLSLVVGGDSRNGRVERVQANQMVAKLRPHAVVFGGDLTGTSADSELQYWLDDWQESNGPDGRLTAFITAEGNHENSGSWQASLVDLFDVPSNGGNNNIWYGLSFGGTLLRLTTLNSVVDVYNAQSTWLENELSTHSATHTWMMPQYHHPVRPHVSSKSERDDIYNEWVPKFETYGVRIAAESDAHTCKTTWPIVKSSGGGNDEGFIRDDANGIVYIGEGCWGAPTRSSDDAKDWTRGTAQIYQFKWLQITQSSIEIRTIQYQNVSSVGSLTDDNRHDIPTGISLWDGGGNGEVITISSADFPSVSVTSPSNGAHYASPQQITITADASDADGTISQVEFFVDDVSIGVDNSSPYSIDYTLPTDGSFAVSAAATDNDDNTASSQDITVLVGEINSVVSFTASSTAEQYINTGAVSTSSSDLELVNETSMQMVGVHFANVQIPVGAVINSATIQFTTDEATSGAVSLNIFAQKEATSDVFLANTNDISGRTTTDASVTWSPGDWTTIGLAGSDQETPNLADVVQEVVDLGAWTASSALTFIITGSDANKRVAGSAGSDVTLEIDYTVGGDGNVKPSVSITAPANLTHYDTPQGITITADASDDGTVTGVEFFVNDVSIGTDNSSPFSADYTITEDGTYNIYAIATDDGDKTGNSSEISISVGDVSSLFADFDGTDMAFSGFGSAIFTKIANPNKTGINTSNNVGQFDGTVETWDGIYSDQLSQKIDFSVNKHFKIKVYSPKICAVLVKFEDAFTPTTFIEKQVMTTATNEWEELSFDFSDAPSGTYDKIVLFFDFGGTEVATYYFDDIMLSSDVLTVISEDRNPKFNAYPNPTHDKLFIDMDNVFEEVTVSLTDFNGKVVLQEIRQGSTIELNLKGIKYGNYILNVSNKSIKYNQLILYR